MALSQMQVGSDSSRFESQLTDLLKDPAPEVSAAACKVLGQMAASGSPSSSTASAVAELLSDPSPAVKASAVESLACMGDEAEAFLEPLCRLFNDKSWKVRVAAVRAVAGCGELGQMYASEVCRLTTNTDARTRVAAVKALEKMGERGACFDEEVEMLMSDNDPEVALAAKKAIQTFFDLKAAALENQTKMAAIAEAALLFPGQGSLVAPRGSQYVKMMSDVKDLPTVKDMLTTAQKILGYDLLKLCLEGPEDQLEQTKFCQPAMYVGGLAGMELLRKENPGAAENPIAVAGLSLGEYTALVKLRGEAMQEAAEASPQKMISLAGLSKEKVEKLCNESKSGPEDVCQIANILFPNGFSCAGSKAAIAKLLEKANATEGCLQAKELKTSGAFHTKCMMPAREKLLAALKEVEPKMKPPTCDLYANLTGAKIPAGTPVPKIVEMLADQLTNCVEWMPCMQAMIQDGISDFYESW
ncbi:MCAT [Symbiodinium natans]|uniref:MCAT protein n=1 Tax=Symbiodinium natans TaxID=878477 RepID=A0A812PA45_9DINO|nr:MCAT [Symbiodinium natans]